MEPRFENFRSKTLVGKMQPMSYGNYNPFGLWSWFMPRRNSIPNRQGDDFFSVEIYPELFFKIYKPENEFQKWAAVEVDGFSDIPEEMQCLTIPEGLYAVFTYKGTAENGKKAYDHIYLQWLPGSGYSLDDRPHFAVMGKNYHKDDPESEEEIWIPVIKNNI